MTRPGQENTSLTTTAQATTAQTNTTNDWGTSQTASPRLIEHVRRMHEAETHHVREERGERERER
jgi:hypothetical protein